MQFTPTEMLGHRETREKMRSWCRVEEACRKSLILTCMNAVYMLPLELGTLGFTLSSAPPHLSLQNQGRYSNETVFQYPNMKDPHLNVGVILSLLQSKKMITAPSPQR